MIIVFNKKLIDQIDTEQIKNLAIIRIAKNAGKTVTLNNLVKEAKDKDLKLALISYGRDGEEVDAITRQEKPRIYIPPHTYFVTASKAFNKSDLKAEIVANTGKESLMGRVNIYQSQSEGGHIELVGINSARRVREIKDMIPQDNDLFLIDGALDRRSSAMPALTEGFILATGAVVGNTVDLVMKRTMHEINRLTMPVVDNAHLRTTALSLFKDGSDGILYDDGKVDILTSRTTFGNIKEIREKELDKIRAFFFNGALIDSFIEKLLYKLRVHDCDIIVRDGTRIFLNKRNLNLLKKSAINLQVLNSLRLLAVTVNPTSPYGVKLDSERLVARLRNKIDGVPVHDIMSQDYQSLKG